MTYSTAGHIGNFTFCPVMVIVIKSHVSVLRPASVNKSKILNWSGAWVVVSRKEGCGDFRHMCMNLQYKT